MSSEKTLSAELADLAQRERIALETLCGLDHVERGVAETRLATTVVPMAGAFSVIKDVAGVGSFIVGLLGFLSGGDAQIREWLQRLSAQLSEIQESLRRIEAAVARITDSRRDDEIDQTERRLNAPLLTFRTLYPEWAASPNAPETKVAVQSLRMSIMTARFDAALMAVNPKYPRALWLWAAMGFALRVELDAMQLLGSDPAARRDVVSQFIRYFDDSLSLPGGPATEAARRARENDAMLREFPSGRTETVLGSRQRYRSSWTAVGVLIGSLDRGFTGHVEQRNKATEPAEGPHPRRGLSYSELSMLNDGLQDDADWALRVKAANDAAVRYQVNAVIEPQAQAMATQVRAIRSAAKALINPPPILEQPPRGVPRPPPPER